MTDARAFRGFRFPAQVILWAVRWYLRFPVSYRDLDHLCGWCEPDIFRMSGNLWVMSGFARLRFDEPAMEVNLAVWSFFLRRVERQDVEVVA